MGTIGQSATGLVSPARRPAKNNRTLFLTEQDRRTIPLYRPPASGPIAPAGVIDRICCGDALDVLARLDGPCADLLVADPPYNLGKDFGPAGTDRMGRDEYAAWMGRWLDIAARLLRPGASAYVCCDWRTSGLVHELLAERFLVRNRITWRREKGRGAKRNWKNNLEDIYFATVDEGYTFNLDAVKVAKRVIAPYRDADGNAKDWAERNGQRVRMTCPSNIWTDLTVPFWSMPENTPHPAQKPEKLIERILAASSDPGDVVLDPFAGSGTTAVVARRMDRRFLAVEINEDYCRLAGKRLARG